MSKRKVSPAELAAAKELLLKNPVAMVIMGVVTLAVLSGSTSRKAPAWVKDLPPLGGRVAGPWRGKGSFGHGFGPSRVTHK